MINWKKKKLKWVFIFTQHGFFDFDSLKNFQVFWIKMNYDTKFRKCAIGLYAIGTYHRFIHEFVQ